MQLLFPVADALGFNPQLPCHLGLCQSAFSYQSNRLGLEGGVKTPPFAVLLHVLSPVLVSSFSLFTKAGQIQFFVVAET